MTLLPNFNSTQVKLVYALCTLHNIIVDNETDPYFWNRSARKRALRDLRHGNRRNTSQRVSSVSDTCAKRFRDEIAEQMWNDYQ